jgi:glutaredoxin
MDPCSRCTGKLRRHTGINILGHNIRRVRRTGSQQLVCSYWKQGRMAAVIDATLQAGGPGVVLFSKSYCPYCLAAKRALKSIGITPVTVELDERDDGRMIQIALLQRTKQRTVPSAWLAGKHIGGSDDVVAGVQSGLFQNVDAGEAVKMAEDAGLQPCGAADGIPCLCHEK